MVKMTQEIGNRLIERSWRLSVAESCTGGMVCAQITDIAGSSQWFDRGFVTYTNESKVAMLNVSQALLDQYGAVSLEVVEAMSRGALANSQSDVALAISGIAGPSGGSISKPVGTVCFSWASRSGSVYSETKLFDGDRSAVRQQATCSAFEGLLKYYL